jgi:hypothetical protein
MWEGWQPSEWIALVGLAVAALGIIVGPLIGYRTAQAIQDRKAASDAELARRSRVQSNREATYVDVLEYAIRTAQGVERTEPIMSYEGAPGPPDPLPDTELRALEARVRAFGSSDVRGALKRFGEAAQAFHIAAADLTATRASALRGQGPDRVPAAWKEADEARKRFRLEVDALSELINKELGE